MGWAVGWEGDKREGDGAAERSEAGPYQFSVQRVFWRPGRTTDKRLLPESPEVRANGFRPLIITRSEGRASRLRPVDEKCWHLVVNDCEAITIGPTNFEQNNEQLFGHNTLTLNEIQTKKNF